MSDTTKAERITPNSRSVVVADVRAEFPNIDHRSYGLLEQSLRTAGFTLLGDFEDLALTRRFPLLRTFVRCMVNSNGNVTAGIYEVRMVGPLSLLAVLGLLPAWIPMIEFDSELSDGTFVSTSYGLWKALVRQCPAAFRRPQSRV